MYAINNVFNAGELSPKMRCRIDVSQYNHGFLYSNNFLLTPYGTIERRPGTLFLTKAYVPAGRVRLIPFKVSKSVYYVAEFGNNYIRILQGATVVAVLNSTYTAAQLDAIDFCQSNDVMFLAHPDHPVRELRRTSATTFELREMPIAYPALLDVNTDDTLTITPSGITGTINLTASAALFAAGHVGGYFELQQQRSGSEIDHTEEGSTTTATSWTSDTVEVRGYWSFVTHGTWKGKVYIDRSEDGGTTWEVYRSFSSEEDNNVESSGTEEDDDIYFRIRIVDYYQTTQEAYNKHIRVIFNNTNTLIYGAVRITAVTDATHATATVVKKLGATTATSYWCEGAWSQKNGFPGCICFFEERLCLASTATRPNTIWASQTNDWNNFQIGDADDDALSMTLASNTTNEIMWMASQSVLLVGTNDSEWIISGGDNALTPSNISARPQSAYGSADVNGRLAGDAILFVQTRGRKVREMVYSRDRQGFIAPDRTILAEHITQSGIVDTCLQQQPDTMLWCLLGNGTIAAFTYERDQEVFGWQRVEFPGGRVESLCAIPLADTDGDTVVFAIRRGTEIYIEQLADREYDDLADACFADSAVKIDGGTTSFTTVTGLTHLEGGTVAVFADGAMRDGAVVSGGTIALAEPAYKVCVGLPYTSVIELNPIEAESRDGSTLLRKKQVVELRVSLYKSVGGEVRAGNDNWQTIVCRDVLSDKMDVAISDKDTFVVELPVFGGYREATSISLRQCDPLPFNVGAVVSEVRLVE